MIEFKMKKKAGQGSVEAPEEGTHMARLVGVVDLDHQPGFEWKGEEIESQYKITFTYELVNSAMQDGRPHWVSEDFKVSDHERSKMYARTRALDPSGTLSNKGRNAFGLINAPCMVTVSLNDKGYPKIDSVSGAPAGIPVPDMANDPFVFSFDQPDMEVFKRLPEFVQNKIKSSLNYNGSPLHKALVEQGETDDKDY